MLLGVNQPTPRIGKLVIAGKGTASRLARIIIISKPSYPFVVRASTDTTSRVESPNTHYPADNTKLVVAKVIGAITYLAGVCERRYRSVGKQ